MYLVGVALLMLFILVGVIALALIAGAAIENITLHHKDNPYDFS